MPKKTAYEIAIALGAKLDKSYGKTMTKGQKMLQALGKGAATVAKTVAVAGAAVVGAAGTLAAKGVSNAMELEKQMSNVGTLLTGTAAQVKARLAEQSQDLLKVSNVTGIITADLSDGLYQIVSALGDTEDSIKIMEIAAKAAKAGNATTTDAVNLLTAVTKGYGDTTAVAQQKAADLAFETVRLGQTSFPDLAASIGRVIPLANTMGVAQEELFGVMATLTGVTGNAAEVTTQLRGTIQGFLQPTAQMTKAMKKLGYTDGQAMIKALGLQGSLDALNGSVKGNEIAFAGLFGSIEAKSAILAMTGAQAETLAEKTEAMYKASGAADRAFTAQTDNLQDQFAKLKNVANNALTSLGTTMLPYLTKALEKITPTVEKAVAALPGIFEKIGVVAKRVFDAIGAAIRWVSDNVVPPLISGFTYFRDSILPGIRDFFAAAFEKARPILEWLISTAVPAIISTLGWAARAVVDVYRSVVDNWSQIAPTVYGVIAAFVAYKTYLAAITLGTNIWAAATKAAALVVKGLSFMTSTIGLVVIAIGVLVAAGVWLYENWEMVCKFFADAWEGIKSVAASVADFFVGIWDGIVSVFKSAVNFFIRGINLFISGINSIKIPDWVPLVGGLGFTIPLIPELAKGTDFHVGGLALVGERGPELVNMPRGSQVTPAQRTEELMMASGGRMNVSFSATYNIAGNADRVTLEDNTRLGIRELKQMLQEIQSDSRRVSFS